jgi:hypothetical protein
MFGGAGQQTRRMWLVSIAQLVGWAAVELLWAAAGTSTSLAAVAGAGEPCPTGAAARHPRRHTVQLHSPQNCLRASHR